MATLGPEAAHIFRICHANNLPWILDHGLHCKNSDVQDPNFVSIGMADLIRKRDAHSVPTGPGGTLSDYVPFYFTPWSIMMLNIKTGHNDVSQRENADIVILVTSLHKLRASGVRYLFTNGHAFLRETDYFEDLADLVKVDWDLLRRKDFKRDPEDPGKLGRYQAEAIIHRHMPVDALSGIACYDSRAQERVDREVQTRGLTLKVRAMSSWYF